MIRKLYSSNAQQQILHHSIGEKILYVNGLLMLASSKQSEA
jgi:hypothetical protein